MKRQGVNRRTFLRGIVIVTATAFLVAPADAKRQHSNNDYEGGNSVRIWRSSQRDGWGLPALLGVAVAALGFVFTAMRFRWLREIVNGTFSLKKEWRALTRKRVPKRPGPPRSWRLRG